MLVTTLGLVSPTQSNPGETIESSDINTPVNQLAAVINGNIETANLADSAVTTGKLADGSVTGDKVADDTLDGSNIDWTATGTDGGIWWEELGRTTLNTTADVITVSSLPARKYLLIKAMVINSGSINAALQFNNDTAANYAYRQEENGSADATAASANDVRLLNAASQPYMVELSVTNVLAQEKIIRGGAVTSGGSGAGNVPGRRDTVGKWANTAAQITRVDLSNTGTGDFASGSQVVVLGHD